MSPAPGYWMHETGGELAQAIRRYLFSEELSVRDLLLIRAYLKQWINAAVWDQNPTMDHEGKAQLNTLRHLAESLTDRNSIDHWLNLAIDFGVDPL